MGCDIHTSLVDLWPKRDERSRYYVEMANDVLRNRNYRLFSVLAGVRGDGTDEFIAPRGLPEWWNKPFDEHEERTGANCGDHSHSWLTIPELRAAAERYRPYPHEGGTDKDRTKRAIIALCDYAEAYADHEPIFVFSFDN